MANSSRAASSASASVGLEVVADRVRAAEQGSTGWPSWRPRPCRSACTLTTARCARRNLTSACAGVSLVAASLSGLRHTPTRVGSTELSSRTVSSIVSSSVPSAISQRDAHEAAGVPGDLGQPGAEVVKLAGRALPRLVAEARARWWRSSRGWCPRAAGRPARGRGRARASTSCASCGAGRRCRASPPRSRATRAHTCKRLRMPIEPARAEANEGLMIRLRQAQAGVASAG